MGRWIEEFPGNLAWSNATLVCKGMAPYGCVSLGEIDRVCDRLRERQGEAQAWWEEWGSMAQAVESRADALEAAGHRRSAGNLYLRAGMYWFTAERFVEPGEHKRELGRRSIEMQGRGLLRRYPAIERVEVDCEGTRLPAWFLPAQGARGPAPAVVVFNGMDNCKEMSVLFAGLEFSARGWHTLAIDGPGQGESLRLRGLAARHDYEVPGAATWAHLAARPDVDARRIAVMGYSFGGYYAARIAAFEPRYVAGVAFAALHWDLHGWQLEIRRRQLADPRSTAQSTFHFQWVMGEDTPEAAIEKSRAFSLEGIASRVTMPFLVLHGEADRVVPVAAAHRLHAELGSRDKALRLFGVEEGGAQHAQVDDRPLGVDAIADWLSTVLDAPGDRHANGAAAGDARSGAVTPDLAHAQSRLGELASRYVDVDALPWRPTPSPLIHMKVLLEDRDTGLMTALFRWQPGAVLGDHEHVRIEQSWVLEGSIEDDEGVCGPGQFVWRPAGSRHAARSPGGALVLAMFLAPNRFLAAAPAAG